jgi:hypothetical protein
MVTQSGPKVQRRPADYFSQDLASAVNFTDWFSMGACSERRSVQCVQTFRARSNVGLPPRLSTLTEGTR